jgi:hypothetical protein
MPVPKTEHVAAERARERERLRQEGMPTRDLDQVESERHAAE